MTKQLDREHAVGAVNIGSPWIKGSEKLIIHNFGIDFAVSSKIKAPVTERDTHFKSIQ